MISLPNIDSMLHRSGGWFLQSGIQEPGGGVARYYRADLGKNARVSTEITGYVVSALLYLAERTGDSSYTQAAVRAARSSSSGWPLPPPIPRQRRRRATWHRAVLVSWRESLS